MLTLLVCLGTFVLLHTDVISRTLFFYTDVISPTDPAGSTQTGSETFAHCCCPCSQANRIDPAAPLPHLGMAQVYCQQGEYINAATELQTALQAAPNCYEGLKVRLEKHFFVQRQAHTRPGTACFARNREAQAKKDGGGGGESWHRTTFDRKTSGFLFLVVTYVRKTEACGATDFGLLVWVGSSENRHTYSTVNPTPATTTNECHCLGEEVGAWELVDDTDPVRIWEQALSGPYFLGTSFP